MKIQNNVVGVIELSNELDIEFGITRNDQIVIFQVRPITSLKSADKKNLDNKKIYCLGKINPE